MKMLKNMTNRNRKAKGVIIYLSQSTEGDIRNLESSLILLENNFNRQHQYPVVIFHEDFDENIMADIQRLVSMPLIFEKIFFDLPEFINEAEVSDFFQPDPKVRPLSVGYRHMCRFFANTVYHHPILADYDWYWRLDTDSFILGPIRYDLFRYMEKKKYIYGYNILAIENPLLCQNLWTITKKYIAENKIVPKSPEYYEKDGEWIPSVFYTNFEICRLDFWRSDNCQKYFDYMDKLGGIYKYRWADTNIHTFEVGMFLEKSQIHQFKDIPYMHWVYIVNPHRWFIDGNKFYVWFDHLAGQVGLYLKKYFPGFYYFLKEILW